MRSTITKFAAAVVVAGLSIMSVSGLAAAAQAAEHSGATAHGFGLDVAKAKANKGKDTSTGTALAARRKVGAAPASYSLKSYAISPGDQGQVGSCVAWATGYSGYGLLMKEQGLSGSPMAPMFIYAQIAKGNDQGTLASVALPMEQQQGIDTKADYWQGDFDYTTQPDNAERANAAHYKISGSTDLTRSGDLVTNVKNSIASGLPVPIGLVVRSSFQKLNTTNYTYNPSRSESQLGGHEVLIIGYDANYVEVENSWGTSWGNHGFFRMPWSVVTGSDTMEVHSIGKLVAA